VDKEFIETRFGRIPTKELTCPNILCNDSCSFSNYLPKLYDKYIDTHSLPLSVCIEGNWIDIIPSNFDKIKTTRLDKVLFLRAGSAVRTVLPNQLTPKLAYFIGYFVGDGGLKDTQKTYKKVKRFEHKIIICDEFAVQVEFIQKLFKESFGILPPIRTERIEKGESLFYINPTNKVVYRFLTKVFGFPPGPKTENIKIPKLICDASDEIKKWFIRGVLDADGDTRAVEAGFNSQARIKLRMKSKTFIQEMKELIQNTFNVSVNGPYLDKGNNSAYIQVERKKDIMALGHQTIFIHPIKRWRLEQTCKHLLNGKQSVF
jgi:hypothetical protein